MECPVCLTNIETSYQLVCGHYVCRTCIEVMWSKTPNFNCPICRRDIVFPRMRHHIKLWDEKVSDDIMSDVFGCVITKCFDICKQYKNYQYIYFDIVKMFEKSINLLGSIFNYSICDELWNEIYVYTFDNRNDIDWMDGEDMTLPKIWEHFTFQKMLFVSKYSTKRFKKCVSPLLKLNLLS